MMAVAAAAPLTGPSPAGTPGRPAGPVSPASRPSSRNTTRSAQAACRTLWVASTSAQPAAQRSRSSPITDSPVSASSAPVGSSASSSDRPPATARAMVTRCCSPPDSWAGNRPRTAPRLSESSRPCAPASAARGFTPSSSRASATFSAAVSPASRLASWKTKPICCRSTAASPASSRLARSRPASRTRPEVGRSSPPASRSRVDLPEPLGPITATNSPAPTRSETSSSALTRSAPDP